MNNDLKYVGKQVGIVLIVLLLGLILFALGLVVGYGAPAGVTFTADALTTVRELKQQEELAIYLCGGGNLAGELLPEIDRLILKRNPVVLGDGVRLFGNAGAVVQNFDLVSCRSFESGVVMEEYARTIRQ